MSNLLKPTLYDRTGDGSPQAVVLKGGRCKCGHVFFPWQTFGCQCCGDVDFLQPMQLEARGRVLSSVLVHFHRSPARPTPFVIAAIQLVDGPVVRTLLASPSEGVPAILPPGQPVVAKLIEVPRPADPSVSGLDLRFIGANT
jgi:uncharacterized protein